MISCSENLDTMVCAKKDLQYHQECYKDSMSKTNVKGSKQHYENMLAVGNLQNVANNQDARIRMRWKNNIEAPSSYI